MFTTLESSGSDNRSDSEDNSTVVIELETDDNTDTETIDADYDSYDDSGSDGGIEYDSIHNEDAFHFYSEKENGKYYIGLCHLYSNRHTQFKQWLLSTSISANSFFRHSYDNINNYLYYYGVAAYTSARSTNHASSQISRRNVYGIHKNTLAQVGAATLEKNVL